MQDLQRGDTIKCKDLMEAIKYEKELKKLGYEFFGEKDFRKDTFTITIAEAPKKDEDQREYWIFTFGDGHDYEGCYVKIYGTYGEARQKMFEKYGVKWAFQHSAKEWEEWEKERPWYFPIEELLEVIE